MSQNPDPIALDVHAHLIPIDPEALQHFPGVVWNHSEEALLVDGHKLALKSLFDPEALLGWMDRNNVEQAWISAPPPTYRPQLRGAQAGDWTNYLCNGLLKVSARSEGRLSPLMHLPVGIPDVAVQIAQQWIGRGHVRFSAPAGGYDDHALSDPTLANLWRVLDEAGAFVFFHPGECADGRLKAFYLSNLLGNPYETAVAIHHLVLGGVVERHVNIKWCFAHAGGVMPSLAGRLERGFETKRPEIPLGGKSPRALLRSICVDCITHDEAALDLAESVFGPSQIVFGSDWPFPMGLPDPHKQSAAWDKSRRARIFSVNPSRLMKKARPRRVPAS